MSHLKSKLNQLFRFFQAPRLVFSIFPSKEGWCRVGSQCGQSYVHFVFASVGLFERTVQISGSRELSSMENELWCCWTWIVDWREWRDSRWVPGRGVRLYLIWLSEIFRLYFDQNDLFPTILLTLVGFLAHFSDILDNLSRIFPTILLTWQLCRNAWETYKCLWNTQN